MKLSNARIEPLGKIEYFFHISRDARNRYQVDQSFYSILGNIIIANFSQARILSEKINQHRRTENRLDEQVTPGLLNAAALFHEIYHFVIREYEEKQNPGAINRTLAHLSESLGEEEINQLLLTFTENFPPLSVFSGEKKPAEFLLESSLGKPNTEIIFEELLLLYLENFNPALKTLKELFDELPLKKTEVYEKAIKQSVLYFETEKPVGGGKESLLKYLLKPILEHPDSIESQLKYIHEQWNISEDIILRILSGTDLIYEDSKIFVQHGDKGGTPPVPVYKTLSAEELQRLLSEGATGAQGKFVSLDEVSGSYLFEEEQFTEDTDWMPRVVMIAKNTFVWLDQLSRKYGRSIKTLDQIPDEELDALRDWHFNALWLIGVWERSTASKKIKQFCGNHDAVSSAYSLFDYEIAYELGAYAAYENLRDRCKARGIRLASDMVPNHTGIFSRWTLEHPDYFVQSSYPPYPGYSFTGPNLSDNPNFEIRIEDKYYSRQDAAVVFQMKNHYDSSVRYIYHGNDGTNMPWNDSAQLNLMRPEVREALYQKIKRVAEMFPIIRFDAAMTLTKRHYQRLWFPQPGTGGAIPSRADFAMTKEMFDAAMPNEFWREVVDRMNQEMPDTLLLAEAFWLMEGYFVRTLGMHRVYNSAFMHMFMKEENYKYRELIKNTMEFNPEILKRYVNFMSNPDEETAINQFGKGDKYFGVTVMLVTLPGLPMFAHGQIDGFTEKYGMEYQRAYYDEVSDHYLVERHKREIFPLTLKRYLFSGVKNFWLFDFLVDASTVNQNVFAFTNAKGGERALTLFNNTFERTIGKIQYTTGKVVGDAQSQDNPDLIYSDLVSTLRFRAEDKFFYTAKEHRSGLEFLFSGREVGQNGFACSLDGYEYKVFIDFTEVYDESGYYNRLYDHLNGNGVPSVTQSLNELRTADLHATISEVFNEYNLKELKKVFAQDAADPFIDFSPYFKGKYFDTVHELQALGYKIENPHEGLMNVLQDLKVIGVLQPLFFNLLYGEKKSGEVNADLRKETVKKFPAYMDLVVIYDIIYRLLSSIQTDAKDSGIIPLFDDLYLSKPLWQNFIRLHDSYEEVRAEFDLLRILLAEFPVQSLHLPAEKPTELNSEALRSLLHRADLKQFSGYNVYQGTAYFNKERLELLLQWYYWMNVFLAGQRSVELAKSSGKKISISALAGKREFKSEIGKLADLFHNALVCSEQSGYQYEKFMLLLNAVAAEVRPVRVKSPVAKEKRSAIRKSVGEKPKAIKGAKSVSKTDKQKVKPLKQTKSPVKKTSRPKKNS